jgi:hypothetical protein
MVGFRVLLVAAAVLAAASCHRDVAEGRRFECSGPDDDSCGSGCTCTAAPFDLSFDWWCECGGAGGDGDAWDGPKDVPWTVQAPQVADRVGATMTLLADGRVLIVGGCGVDALGKTEAIHGRAELFDPVSGSFREVAQAMSIGRAWHEAARLDDGRVAVLGGMTVLNGSPAPTPSVELFDPATETFSATTDLPGGAGRASFTAAVVPGGGGAILVVGGKTAPAAASGYWDLYVPGVGAVGHGALHETRPRWNHTMTLLPRHRDESRAFVIAGGEDQDGATDRVEVLAGPVQGAGGIEMVPDGTASLPGGARTHHAAVYVPKQRFLYIVGGFTGPLFDAPTGRVDVYDESAGVFPEWGFLTLTSPRGAATATLSGDTTIVIAGGLDAGGRALSSVEQVRQVRVTQPDGSPYYVVDRVPSAPLAEPRWRHLALWHPVGRLFLLGGFGADGKVAAGAVYYTPD